MNPMLKPPLLQAKVEGHVTEAEIRAVLRQHTKLLVSELMSHFRGRLAGKEAKAAFIAHTKRIATTKEDPTGSGKKFVVLRK